MIVGNKVYTLLKPYIKNKISKQNFIKEIERLYLKNERKGQLKWMWDDVWDYLRDNDIELPIMNEEKVDKMLIRFEKIIKNNRASQSNRKSKRSNRKSKRSNRKSKRSKRKSKRSNRKSKRSKRKSKRSKRKSKRSKRKSKRSNRKSKRSNRKSKRSNRKSKRSNRKSKRSNRKSKRSNRKSKRSNRKSKRSNKLSRKHSKKSRSRASQGRSKKSCDETLQRKIGKNIGEWKKGRYSSKKQALAVSYAQVRKSRPECSKYYRR